MKDKNDLSYDILLSNRIQQLQELILEADKVLFDLRRELLFASDAVERGRLSLRLKNVTEERDKAEKELDIINSNLIHNQKPELRSQGIEIEKSPNSSVENNDATINLNNSNFLSTEINEDLLGEDFKNLEAKWSVILALSYSKYFLLSEAAARMAPAEYKNLVQRIALACQELGIRVTIPLQEDCSYRTVKILGTQVEAELRLIDTRLVNMFDFILKIYLLLPDDVTSIANETEVKQMEFILTRSVRKAGLLDSYIQQLIKNLTQGTLSNEERNRELVNFMDWAYRKAQEMA